MTRFGSSNFRTREGVPEPNRGANDSVLLLPLVGLIDFWSYFNLNRIDMTLDYKIVLHLLLPEVEVRTVELPETHFR